MDYFGQNLKALRKRMGLTQQELAEKFGVRKTTISNYETSVSSPPKNGLVEIANFFGVSLDELLSAPDKAHTFNASPVLNSPKAESFIQNRTVKIFSSIKSLNDIISVRNLVDTVSFSNIKESGEYFGLVVRGDHFCERGINDGDYIIFKALESVKNGDIVLISVNDEPAVFGILHETETEIGFIPPKITEKHLPKFWQKSGNNINILGKAVRAVVNMNF